MVDTLTENGEDLNKGTLRRFTRKQRAEQSPLPVLPMVKCQAIHPNGAWGKIKKQVGSHGLGSGNLPTSFIAFLIGCFLLQKEIQVSWHTVDSRTRKWWWFVQNSRGNVAKQQGNTSHSWNWWVQFRRLQWCQLCLPSPHLFPTKPSLRENVSHLFKN